MYGIVLYAILTELWLGFKYNVIVKGMNSHRLRAERLSIPGFFYQLQKIWPLATVAIMAVINLVTVWLCSGLTSILYLR